MNNEQPRITTRAGSELSEADAKLIIQMADVCFNEGIGPNDAELLEDIYAQRPDLFAEYGHILRTRK